MLKSIIDAIETATGLTAYPIHTSLKTNCIVYVYSPVSDDGAVARHRIEIRVITDTMADAEKYRKKIITTLVPSGDNIKIQGVLGCELNGGGQLDDLQMNTIHTFMYFDYVTKSDNNYLESEDN